MIITRHQNADEYLSRTQAALESAEAANNLMLGIAMRLKESPGAYGTVPYFATVVDEGGLILAGLMTPPFKTVLYGHRPDMGEALEMMVRDLWEDGWNVPGILGPSNVAGEFAAVWTSIVGHSHGIAMHQRVYELRKVSHIGSAPGRLRLGTQEDVGLLTEWHLGFHMHVFGQGNREQAAELAIRRVNDKEVYVWEHEKPVSMAARVRPTANGITVNGVYTPPELRGRGYATACVASLSQSLLDSGWKFCALFADLANPISNAIYQKIGYRSVCDFTEYSFQAET